ncbi:MAG TPA: hypothetical protein VKV39_20755 [Candidatus Sulfotelmatobacter sp.]|nr:hypothetical protein [Candidatus Sulfotelmatobacter sp.]
MMERRRFLKGLATTPVGLMLAEIACKQGQPAESAPDGQARQAVASTNAKKTLNVFVHGMFAIVLDEKQSPAVVVLKAPDVGMHKYLARTFTINPTDANDLKPGWIYPCPQMGQQDSVNFPGGSSKIPSGIGIGKLDHIAIDIANLNPGAQPHWTVTLPMPDQICGLRATPYNYFAAKPTLFASRTFSNNAMSSDQHMPLVYVLSYQNIDANQGVRFNGADNLAIDFGNSGIGRLHLYAEPDAPPPGPLPNGQCHVNVAIDQLDQLFKPRLDLQFLDNTCDPKFGVYPDGQLPCTMNNSIVLCDERSLDEIGTNCSDLLSKGTLEKQFQDVIAIETQFTSAVSVEGKSQKVLPKIGKRVLPFWYQKKLFDALPNSKPPHNCTSLLCLKRK